MKRPIDPPERASVKPVEARQYDHGWIITCFGGDGRVRHVATADSGAEALQAARRMIEAYRLPPTVLFAPRGKQPAAIEITAA